MTVAIDLFCRVIDNYGDIGVCWRLARQLVAEHDWAVRLIVDDLHAFRFIAPEIDASACGTQSLLGVNVVPWAASDALVPADVVIEAFACDPPASYVQAMAARMPKPVWLNLEYLSAEAWVEGVHGRPSPHPRLPLSKFFFCPGFTEQTGGLIREREWTPVRFERGGGKVQNTLALLAFTYPHAPVRALVDALAHAGYDPDVTLAAPLADAEPGWRIASPVPQPDFDALLASFDVLVVRGEDSFVRAQWAGKPMLWHIYPTDDAAHLIKLDAWLDRYVAALPDDVAAAYRAASHAFVQGETSSSAYADFARHLPAFRAHAVGWRDRLMAQSDLGTRLVAFIGMVKSQKVG